MRPAPGRRRGGGRKEHVKTSGTNRQAGRTDRETKEERPTARDGDVERQRANDGQPLRSSSSCHPHGGQKRREGGAAGGAQ